MDIGKIEINNCLFQNDQFSLREFKFPGNMYISFSERLASAKVEKVLWLQRNDKKLTLLLIWFLRKVFSRIIISIINSYT